MHRIILSDNNKLIEVSDQNLPPLGCLEGLFGYIRNRWKEGWIIVKIFINDNEHLIFDRTKTNKISGKINSDTKINNNNIILSNHLCTADDCCTTKERKEQKKAREQIKQNNMGM